MVGYQRDKLNQTDFIFCIHQVTCTMTHVSEPILKTVLILILTSVMHKYLENCRSHGCYLNTISDQDTCYIVCSIGVID